MPVPVKICVNNSAKETIGIVSSQKKCVTIRGADIKTAKYTESE